VALVGALALPVAARAEGPGFRIGDRVVLHLGLISEIRYDSNVFYEPSNPSGAAILRLVPRLDIATRPTQRGGGAPHAIDFRLSVGMDYNEILSGDAALSGHRGFGVFANGLLTILPNYPFSIDISDNFTRTSQLPYQRGINYNLDRDTNEAGIRFRYHPGTGRLDLQLGYVFGLDMFEVEQLKDLNLIYNKINLRGSWKFFPKTALWIEAQETIYTYLRPGLLQHPDSYPLRVMAGVTGLLTFKLTLNVWIGYGNGFYVSGPSPNTAIGGLELRWRPTMLSTGALGYRHDFTNSLLGSFYDVDAVYISWSQYFWKFMLGARLQYQNIRYQGIGPNQAVVTMNGQRTDNNIQVDVNLDYVIRDWARLSLFYVLQYNDASAQINLGPQGIIPANYLKNEVGLRMTLAY